MDKRIGVMGEQSEEMKPWKLLAYVWANSPLLRSLRYRIGGHRSLASFFLPDRQGTVKIQGGLNKYIKMHLNTRDEHTYFLGIHEPDVQWILPRVVRPGMTVYNIGGHLGFFTLALNLLVGPAGHVVTFEPHPQVRERLIENVSLNGMVDSVSVEEAALGDFDGTAEFSLSLNDTQGRFADLPHVKPGSVIQVQCKRFDTYVRETGRIPHFILMDVEHAEGRVLRGMFETIEAYKPLIVIETHGPEAIEETWVELKKHQYLLATVPGLEIVASSDMVRYGHYLAAHRSYFEQNLG